MTAIERWNPEPGDRLLVYIEDEHADNEQCRMVREHVKAALQLGDDFPVVVVTPQIRLTVLTPPAGG